jgi:phage protein D
MPFNNLTANPVVRQPRLRILCNGQEIGGPIEFEVVNNNYYQSDTFTAQFAFRANPNFNLIWWGGQTEILIDIQSSLDGGQTWVSHIIGDVDHMSVSVEKGVISVDGRDLTSRFIDNKTQETFQNKTSSQIVQILAARRGLTADVTPTTTPVGRYYQADHDRISMGQFVRTTTEWNLLSSLAQDEGFDIWVTGTTLHFHPSTPPTADPYLVQWQEGPSVANAISLQVQRNLTVAKDVVVVVRSWNSQMATSIERTSGAVASANAGNAQQFTVVRPNLTQQQAQDLANKLRADITQHERVFSFQAPADQTLSARDMVQLTGTGSSWDQAYYVDWVRRRMTLSEGFTMQVQCKNHSPQSQAAG